MSIQENPRLAAVGQVGILVEKENTGMLLVAALDCAIVTKKYEINAAGLNAIARQEKTSVMRAWEGLRADIMHQVEALGG